jgi:hypothetical protein
MTKFVLSLLSVGIAFSAAPVFADTVSQPYRYTRDGQTYVIATRITDGGDKILSGYEEKTGRQFKLRVSHGRVNGEYGGTLVSYDVPPVSTTAAAD